MTHKPYDYHAVSSRKFVLCATFSADATNEPADNTGLYADRQHKAGYDCVPMTIPDGIAQPPTDIPLPTYPSYSPTPTSTDVLLPTQLPL